MRKSQVVLGVPVSKSMLLTDQPDLLAAIARGDVHGFMPADDAHPATQWLVQVDGVKIIAPDKQTAYMLFYAWSTKGAY
ncbi:hypothetical protein LCAA2362_2845 [Lacticaseibacillus casei A2-362]|uniref:hypothetical protein n=1 Tax=Lacticaseibacillus paracasei TaxID=1597 RepID=UPI0002976C20|nr:hypothetical protein [Lacticaseibacillus paracasei]EKQ13023.1 hypothetical protein LCAA2362_2845 [Lacticaseibacillus casei A2-362]MDN4553319.1 hypothetical protein [Lacticaseibacillus paracasei]